MSLTVTLALLVVALALAVFAGWRGSRPWDLTRGVRMIPWRFIMLLSGAAILVLVIHLGTLMGVPQRPY
ncbi:MAG: hypothetical protein FD125_1504 [bacterium]|nr:MAG: hypothetical protein FD125_1504 [bacterium]